jgi:hypothetical protein
MRRFVEIWPVVATMLLLILGTSAVSRAGEQCVVYVPTVPEIDAVTSVAALSLISGVVLIVRARRKK